MEKSILPNYVIYYRHLSIDRSSSNGQDEFVPPESMNVISYESRRVLIPQIAGRYVAIATASTSNIGADNFENGLQQAEVTSGSPRADTYISYDNLSRRDSLA